MQSILEQINKLNLEDWNYYCKDIEKPFHEIDEKKYIAFIKEYFRISEKEVVLHHFENENFKINDLKKPEHTLSVFFLGCLFYKNLKLKDNINFFRDNNHIKDEFYFIWFLISLSHDLAKYYEHNFVLKDSDITGNVESLKNHFKIKKYDLLNQKINNYSKKTITLFNQISNYFKYRYSKGKLDHGIVAGLNLYSSLIMNRVERKQMQDDRVESSNLYWGIDLDKFYEESSIAIATHNIWKPSVKDEKEYKDAGMEDLINDIFPISIEDFPLLFLLGLVDTIEPTKTLCSQDISVQEVLAGVLIEFDDNRIIIKSYNDTLPFSKLVDKIRNDLTGWLLVTFPEIDEKDNCLIIEFN